MRRTAKFFHTMGAIGLTGAVAAQLVLLSFVPDPSSLEAYAQARSTMNGIAQWLVLPSLTLVLLTGLWSMAITPAFHNAGWVWLKLAMGILVFKGVLFSIIAPAEREALLAASALAGQTDIAQLAQSVSEERGVLWVILFVSIANVVLGVWRPRFSRKKRNTEQTDEIAASQKATEGDPAL